MMIQELDDAALKQVADYVIKYTTDELLSKTEAELENYWYFSYDAADTAAWNMYQFNQCLDIYRRKCRQWEEHYNGNCCVVERVRDKYLMPKIQQFLSQLQAASANNGV